MHFFDVLLLLFVTRAEKIEYPDPFESQWDGFSYSTNWSEAQPACAGRRQSPISFTMQNMPNVVDADFTLNDFNITLDLKLRTRGERLVIDGFKEHWRPGFLSPTLLLEKSPKEIGTFKLREIVFHWGSDDGSGCEHYFAEECAAVEVQYMFEVDQSTRSGIKFGKTPIFYAGIAIHYKSDSDADNWNMNITDKLDLYSSTLHEEKGFALDLAFNVSSLLPDTGTAYLYHGSHTFPPCTENVVWLFLEEDRRITSNHLQALRALHLGNDAVDINYRNQTFELCGYKECSIRKVSFRSLMSNRERPTQGQAFGRTLMLNAKFYYIAMLIALFVGFVIWS